jgi:hypothetical protein
MLGMSNNRQRIISLGRVLALVSVAAPAAFAFTRNADMATGRESLRDWRLNAKITAADVLKDPQFPPKWPYTPKDFTRQDESEDSYFYQQPRLVQHIDDKAIASLTKIYKNTFPEVGAEVLDTCSSWISHFQETVKFKRAVGLGMNKYELEQNKQLSEWVATVLNKINCVVPHCTALHRIALHCIAIAGQSLGIAMRSS